MLEEKTVAESIWTIRLMRPHGDELSVPSVSEKQRSLWFHAYDAVTRTLQEIGNCIYHWTQSYPDISDACILVL